MNRILILRPEPGATETAERARKLGLEALTAPMFTIRRVAWDSPDRSGIDAVILTSANAARHGGEALADFKDLPCYAVGESTAESARAAGFVDVRAGPGDGAALIEIMANDGMRRALHLCGRDHIPLTHRHVSIVRRIVYVSEPVERLPAEAVAALRDGALVLLHSQRAGARFEALIDEAGIGRSGIDIAAISAAAMASVGGGWDSTAAAAEPRDEALLELAVKLCKIAVRAG